MKVRLDIVVVVRFNVAFRPKKTNKQNKKTNKTKMVKDHFLALIHLSGTVCPKHSATLILPPLFKAAIKTHLFNNYF